MDVVSRLSFSRNGEESLERSQRDASLCLTSDACPPFSRGGRKQDENFRPTFLSPLATLVVENRPCSFRENGRTILPPDSRRMVNEVRSRGSSRSL